MFARAALPNANLDVRAESVRELAIRVYSGETVIVKPGTTDYDNAHILQEGNEHHLSVERAGREGAGVPQERNV